MAVGDILGSLKNTVKTAYNNFFYSGRQAPRRAQETYPEDTRNQAYPPQQAGGYQTPYQQFAYQQNYQQQPAYQQPVYQQNAGMGHQPVFQQAQQQPPQTSQAQPAQSRMRRAQMHAARQQENVVEFSAYQQNMARQNEQNAPSPEPPVQEASQTAASLLSARVINARGMSECRSAITLLRNGDAVVIVMENIADPGEMRRLVDTLSGACYSLTATITKVSRHGVYLLAPQTMAVFADQATNVMNNAPVRAQPHNYQPAYTGQRVSYAPQTREAQPVQPAQPQQYSNPQAFTQRAAEPEEMHQSFYQRPAPQAVQPPAFSAQPAGYGYAPDEVQAVDQ